MKRLSLLLVAAALAVALTQGPCLSIPVNWSRFPFPAVHFGLQDGVGNGTVRLPFYQGWFEGQLAWYILENGSSDINTNHWIGYRSLFPKLQSAIEGGANPVYVVLNYSQGPVFTSMPGHADYSALWQVFYVKWKPGIVKRAITDDGNLPPPDEADIIETDIVVDRPIIAIGQLGGPWYPAPPGRYRIKQAVWVDVRHKWISLPFWYVYGQDNTTHRVSKEMLLIPDTADPDLAALLGANYAPGLDEVDDENTQELYVQDWTVAPYPPLSQFPILEELPHYAGNFGRLNDNFEFSNVMDFQLFVRTSMPPWSIVNNPMFLQDQLGISLELEGDPIRINGLVPDFVRMSPGG